MGAAAAGIVASGCLFAPQAEGSILFWDSFEYGDERDNIQDVSDWETGSGVIYYEPDEGLTHPGLQAEAGGAVLHDFGSGNRGFNRNINIDVLQEGAAGVGDEFWFAGLIQLANHDGTTRIRWDNESIVNPIGFGTNDAGNAILHASEDGAGSADLDTGISVAADGSTYLFLVRAEVGPGDDSDRQGEVDFWFDPQDTSSVAALGSPDYTATDSKFGRGDNAFDEITVNFSFQSRVDEFRMGTTLDSVIIAEPASLALLGLGGLLLVRRRREQQRD